MKVLLQPAYCMHARPFRESSHIAEMLTPEYGLVSCVHRGSRRRAGSAKLLFTPMLISWSGRGELYTLTHAEADGHSHIVSPDACIVGMYLNELVLRLVPKSSPSREIFDLYRSVVTALGDSMQRRAKLLRLFEVELLELTGHGLFLDKEADHETEIQCEGLYRYDVDAGAVRIHRASSAWNVVSGAALIALRSPLAMDPACLDETKRFMRGVLSCHVGSRPLRSREILQFMQAP